MNLRLIISYNRRNFNIMSYRNYIKPAREVLKRFDIYEELYSEDNYSVSKASLKSNINLHYLLIIEKFASSPANFQR